MLNSYKNITKSDLYKDGKSYKKYLKSVLPALYAAYRFSRDKRGNTIILKETTKLGKLLDEYFKLGKSLDKSNKYKIVQYKNGELIESKYDDGKSVLKTVYKKYDSFGNWLEADIYYNHDGNCSFTIFRDIEYYE